MFMGPLDGSKPWNPRDVPGMFRFLRDCWRMIIDEDESKPGAGNLRMNLLPRASEMIGERRRASSNANCTRRSKASRRIWNAWRSTLPSAS